MYQIYMFDVKTVCFGYVPLCPGDPSRVLLLAKVFRSPPEEPPCVTLAQREV